MHFCPLYGRIKLLFNYALSCIFVLFCQKSWRCHQTKIMMMTVATLEGLIRVMLAMGKQGIAVLFQPLPSPATASLPLWQVKSLAFPPSVKQTSVQVSRGECWKLDNRSNLLYRKIRICKYYYEKASVESRIRSLWDYGSFYIKATNIWSIFTIFGFCLKWLRL